MTNPTIGILAGSGPEAGLDLWSKVLENRRGELADRYRGDIDAPAVVVISEPELGLSMDLANNAETVWAALERAARQLASQVDVWAIACNTLNHFAPQLDGLELDATLITPDGATARYLDAHGLRRIGLLGARPVVELGELSPYTRLVGEYDFDTPSPADRDRLHRLIEEIKVAGGPSPEHADQLEALVIALPPEAEKVLLACTELPFIEMESQRELVDVTALVAAELVNFR